MSHLFFWFILWDSHFWSETGLFGVSNQHFTFTALTDAISNPKQFNFIFHIDSFARFIFQLCHFSMRYISDSRAFVRHQVSDFNPYVDLSVGRITITGELHFYSTFFSIFYFSCCDLVMHSFEKKIHAEFHREWEMCVNKAICFIDKNNMAEGFGNPS